MFESKVCAGKLYNSVSSAREDSQVASVVVHASTPKILVNYKYSHERCKRQVKFELYHTCQTF